MITGKNKERFNEWYNQQYEVIFEVEKFYRRPFEMQQGVYLAYYDSIGYSIETMTTIDRKTKLISYEVDIYDNEMNQIEGLYLKYKTRNEALTEALKQADKLENEKLK